MSPQRTLLQLLDSRARQTPHDVFAICDDHEIDFRTLETKVYRLANGLSKIGVGPGQRVAVMLGNHADHVFTLFALSALRAVWVPVNVNLRGGSLEWIFSKASPKAIIAEEEYWGLLEPLSSALSLEAVVLRGAAAGLSKNAGVLDYAAVVGEDSRPPVAAPAIHDTRAIMFTSGTTGMPKGALMTERMLHACAMGAGIAADIQPGDVFLLWEPIYHSAGAEMCVLALQEPITLAIVPRFSASRFWDQVRRYRVTKLHYLGGVLEILLKQPPRPEDRSHSITLAFGAGCTPRIWEAFEQRFGIKVHEVYGLTEGSGFTTLNASGKVGSIGKPYPYLDVCVVDDAGSPLPYGQVGEIIMRGKQPGLITEGYLENPEATAGALRDGWLYTGDLGYYDEQGDFYFVGRKTDSIRRRGENISAWEVERILNSHPLIQESAVIGVPAEVGEEDLKAFIQCVPGAALDPAELIRWCEPRMPYFQIPRYIVWVNGFDKTPTQRIRKKDLSRDTQDCWDRERMSLHYKRS
jgi:crotonobetaine/carnitine-CoA ligase